ncbi:hypothetical protein MAJ_07987, partial [Metarhizium majus ARSEF 297]
MEPPKDLVIAISGGFSVHKKKGKKNKALKQQDIKEFFKAKGVTAYLSKEIGNSGRIQDDEWNVLLSSDDDKGGETAIFKGAKQKGLCILGEAWLQGCIDEDKVIQPREEHFRQKPTKRAYSTPHRTPSVFEYLNSEKEGTSDEANEKDRERAEEKRERQEEKERKGKEKEEAERNNKEAEEKGRREEEEKEEEEKKKRREEKKKRQEKKNRKEEEKNGESGTNLSGNDGSETESSGEESDSATNSSSGGEESDTDMDSDEEFQQFSQNVDPAVRERMEWYRSGNKDGQMSHLIAPYHPSQKHLPRSERTREDCRLIIEFVYKNRIFVTDPTDTYFPDEPNLRALYSLNAKDHSIEKEEYTISGGHVLDSYGSEVLEDTDLNEFDWWGVSFDGRYGLVWGRPQGEEKPMLFTRTAMKKAFGSKAADKHMNQIRTSLGQLDIETMKSLRKSRDEVTNIRDRLRKRKKINYKE